MAKLLYSLLNNTLLVFELDQERLALKQLNEQLEKIVEARTTQLKEENRKMAGLLNNMRQGIFSVDDKQLVVAPVSKYCEEIFGKSIVNENIFEILYSNIPKESEEFSILRASLSSALGGSDLQFDLVAGHFPKRIMLKNGDKILKASQAPMLNEQEEVEKLLYIIEDVTEFEKLQQNVAREREHNARNIQLIQEMLNCEKEELQSFFKSAYDFVKECQDLLSHIFLDESKRIIFFRNLHTLKGNARTHSFRLISSIVHDVETLALSASDEKQPVIELPQVRSTKILDGLNRIKSQLDEYTILGKRAFKMDLSSMEQEAVIRIPTTRFKRLQNAISEFSNGPTQEKAFLVKSLLERAVQKTISAELRKCANMVSEVATSLGKKVEFSVHGDEPTLDSKRLSLVFDLSVHLIRNALDHGIESQESRIRNGKPEVGKISITCTEEGNQISLVFEDDGQGIDAEKVCSTALQKGMIDQAKASSLSYQQKLELIFLPELSTKSTANEISGRGIGADVVKTNVEKLGGSITLSSVAGKGAQFKIKIPIADQVQ